MPNLRLCRETDADQPDPPAPIPFAPTHPGRSAGTDTKDEPMDAIDYAQRALDNAQSKMDELNQLWREEEACFSIKDWMDNDDDGPSAA